MKRIQILLVEDQPYQYKEYISKIKGYNIPSTDVIDIGCTSESTYLGFLEKIQSQEQLPTIILIDYELTWKARSSSANGHELATGILHLYPEGGLPFVIFISGPHPDKIVSLANVFTFIDEEANAISLDKSKFDLPHSKSGYSMLQFAIHKGIKYAKQNMNVPILVKFNRLREYPKLHEIAANYRFQVLQSDFDKGDGMVIEVDLKNLLFIIFKSATDKDYMLIVTAHNGKINRWLKPMERNTVGYWVNSFRSAGINFFEMSSIFCNPLHFEYIGNSIRTRKAQVFSLIEYEFKTEFGLFQNDKPHPFKKQIDSILPPTNENNRSIL